MTNMTFLLILCAVFMHVKAMVYQEDASIYVATAIGGCPLVRATYLFRGAIVATAENCSALGGQVNTTNTKYCDLDWCVTDHFEVNTIYMSAPGGCGSNYRAQGSIEVLSEGCEFKNDENFYLWGQCLMDFCVASKLTATVIYPTRRSKCPNGRFTQINIKTTKAYCKNIGGGYNGNPQEKWIDCHLDLCKQQITVRKHASIYVATAIGGCPLIGALYMSKGAVVATAENCSAMGGQLNSRNTSDCVLDWCVTDHFEVNSIYISAPGGCGSDYRAQGSIAMCGEYCVAMGGVSAYSQGQCQMDFCVASKLTATVIYPTRISECPNVRHFDGRIKTIKRDCQNMGGGYNGNPLAEEWIDCHLDFCKQQISVHKHVSIYVATAIGGCPLIGALYMCKGAVVASAENCSAMGGQLNSRNTSYCDLDWCVTDHFEVNGIYISAPGSCGSDYRAQGSIGMSSEHCKAMGGTSTYSRGQCQMDFCVASKLNATVIYPTRISECPNDRLLNGSIKTLRRDCQNMGGGYNGNPLAKEWIDCHLDFCKQQIRVKGDPIFYFPLDTNEDLTWMKGNIPTEAPANSLIIGKVNNAIQTKGYQREWIDLGNLSAACITHPDACTDGGTFTAWIYCDDNIMISSYKKFQSGFIIQCRKNFVDFYVEAIHGAYVLRREGEHDGWNHITLIWNSPKDGITAYYNGALVGSKNTTLPRDNTPGTGYMVIGKVWTDLDEGYFSTMIDEMIFWNRQLTAQEIQDMYITY